MNLKPKAIPILCAVLVAAAACDAETDTHTHSSSHHEFRVLTVVEGLERPWGVTFLPGGDMLVTERTGRLRLVRGGQLVDEPVGGLPDIHVERQGGLLDVVLHPGFAENRFVYLTYAKLCADGERNTTAVGRGRWADDHLSEFSELYAADACAKSGHHFGSRLVFDGNGYMFMSVGDRGDMPRAQDPTDNAGNTLRLHDDGRIPADNPFADSARGHAAVWSYGNRNIQGMARNPANGELWANEHGARGGDEINVIEPGVNYGWPAATLGVNYDGSIISERSHEEVGAVMPIHEWTPSIAPSGMAFYTGDQFQGWRGDVFVGALSHEHLARLRFDGHRLVEQERLLEGIGRVRDVRQGPDGFLYLLIDAADGRLLRLEPAGDR